MAPISSSAPANAEAEIESAGAAEGTGQVDPGAEDAGGLAETDVPATLNTRSGVWFDAVCGGVSDCIDPGKESGSAELAAADQIVYVRSISAALTGAAAIAVKQPAPTVAGGGDLAPALSASLARAGSDLAAAVDAAVAAAGGSAASAASAAVDAERLYLPQAVDPLVSFDPTVLAALDQFPSCQKLGF